MYLSEVDASREDIEINGISYTPMIDGSYRIFDGDEAGSQVFYQDQLFDMMPSVTTMDNSSTYSDDDVNDFLYRKNEYSSYKNW